MVMSVSHERFTLWWGGRGRGHTLHRKTRLPLELGRVAPEEVVRAEDHWDVGFCQARCQPLSFVPGRGAKRGGLQLCIPPICGSGVTLEKLPE